MSFNFDPVNGLNDKAIFPSVPTSEIAARQQFMTLFNQIRDYLNSENLNAGSLGGKKYTDFLTAEAANQTYSKNGHSHEYSPISHTHLPSSCGFTYGTTDPNNSDGQADGSIYYKVEG